jgi:hypothetical protein
MPCDLELAEAVEDALVLQVHRAAWPPARGTWTLCGLDRIAVVEAGGSVSWTEELVTCRQCRRVCLEHDVR